jgi:hypothetical protein
MLNPQMVRRGLSDTYVDGFVAVTLRTLTFLLFLLSFSTMCDSIWYQPFEALVFLDGRFHICSTSPANRSPCFPLPSTGSAMTERLSIFRFRHDSSEDERSDNGWGLQSLRLGVRQEKLCPLLKISQGDEPFSQDRSYNVYSYLSSTTQAIFVITTGRQIRMKQATQYQCRENRVTHLQCSTLIPGVLYYC